MKHLSLETSRKLREMADKAGVELPKRAYLLDDNSNLYTNTMPRIRLFDGTRHDGETIGNFYHTYSWQEILIDHAKFFFGEEDICFVSKFSENKFSVSVCISYLQQNKVDEAEAYFLDNLTFKK